MIELSALSYNGELLGYDMYDCVCMYPPLAVLQ